MVAFSFLKLIASTLMFEAGNAVDKNTIHLENIIVKTSTAIIINPTKNLLLNSFIPHCDSFYIDNTRWPN